MKKTISFVLLILLLFSFSSCTKKTEEKKMERYQATFLSLFDTVSTIVGYAESEEEFSVVVQEMHDELYFYHKLFDIYNSYDGINNIKTINDNAGIAPVVVDKRIIDMLSFARDMYYQTDGSVNIAMGSVLSLWHEARQLWYDNPDNAYIPDEDALKEASKHTDIECMIIDEASSTVYLSDKDMRLDVGAIAKGYAVECVSRDLPGPYLISVGGNVSSSGLKPDESAWVVGLQNPNDENAGYTHTVYLERGAVVTSGDYQRYYYVDGVRYSHIIDPDTLFPSRRWKAVSVIADNSAIADSLSTALFIKDREEGQRLLDSYDAVAMWTDLDGNEIYSDRFSDILRR